MYGKHIAVGLIATTMLATSALAQTPSASPSSSSNPMATSSSSYQGDWRASKVIGLNVYNDGNESLGSINDLLTDKNGKIAAVVVGVGGFLGVGERFAAIPFEKVKFVNEPMKPAATATNSAMPGTRPVPNSTTTTGAATGAVAPGTTTTTVPNASPAMTAAPNPWYPDHAVVSVTKDELKAMAEFKYSN